MNVQPEPRSSAQPMLVSLAAGLFFIAAVPGAGWLWGQFWETVVLCIGGVLLLYAAFAYMTAVNGRLDALERQVAEFDRTKR